MPHLLYLAIGFPPAAKSCSYRMRATANLFRSLGWDVTVLTLPVQAWELEFGVDWTLMDDVDPGIRVVEMPLMRADLDPQVRNYSWLRARYPDRWRTWRHRLDMVRFPERVFGSWRDTIVRSALAVHSERPADLALITPAPYTALAAARPLHRRGVPFVVDYRDAWSLDVIKGIEAFGRKSRRGRIEQKLMSDATRVWCVNEPIADFYRQRYPATADRIRVVRNGFDASDHLSHPPRPREHGEPLHFGYLGTINFPVTQTTAMLAGWRAAREWEPLLDGARFTIRGHIGAGAAKGATSHALRIARHHPDDVSYGGPVVKAEVHDVYAGWDALVLCLVGGRYVTSGKVYEYMATGLPIVSIHEPDHAATDLLRDYPLHVATRSLSESDITDAFVRAARLAATATPEQRLAARAVAARYERVAQLRSGVLELHGLFSGGAPDRAREETGELVLPAADGGPAS